MQTDHSKISQFGSRELECFLEHYSEDQVENFGDYYLGTYDSEIELICELLAEIESLDELLLFIQPYLNNKEILQELSFRNGLIVHEDFDYIVFRS
jgi:hypothetical protein